MRIAIVSLVALGAVGCARPSPCDGITGACIGAHISGSATGLRQLLISIDQPQPKTVQTPDPPAPISLPARVALVLPAGTTGSVHVAIDGLDANAMPVAHDDKTVVLPSSGRTDVDFTLDRMNGGGGSGGGDLGPSGPDMSNGVFIAGAADTAAFELEPVSITFSASDQMGTTDFALTATGIPATATFTPSGAMAMLTWTPSLSEAGDYPISITATSASDATRTVTTPFVLHVKNVLDPMLNPFGVSPDQLVLDPVGDVDGDGLADFAFCSINIQANMPAQYSVQLVYGDKSGLPTARPYPTARTRTITFAAPAGSSDGTSSSNQRTPCTGGDVDGDGKSDVLLADIYFTPPGGGAQTGVYWLVYGTARADTAAPALLEMLPTGTDRIGVVPIVGDWNGDGLADFATVQANVPSPGASATASVYMFVGHFPRMTGSVMGQAFSYPHICGTGPTLVGFGAVTGVNGPGGKKAHPLIWYDDAVAADGTFQTTGSCGATNGGLRMLSAGIQFNGIGNVSSPNTLGGLYTPYGVCDVDGDGIDDIVALTKTANNKWATSVTYGKAAGFTNPLDTSKKLETPIPSQDAPRIACWASGFGPSRWAVSDPGAPTSGGFLAKGTVYFFVPDANGVPVQMKALTNFDTNMNYSGFGEELRTPGDLDGDGKPDLVIGYQSGFSMPDFGWVLYGR